MSRIYSFEEFVNEGQVAVKRKYTDIYPAKLVSEKGPTREKVLSFVKENGTVTYEDMMEFMKSMNEETGGSTSRKWLTKNPQYFKVIAEKDGTKSYKLSLLGERVHTAIQKLNNI